METEIQKQNKPKIREEKPAPMRLINPRDLDFTCKLRVTAIELSEEYTRIDFLYQAPHCYANGGWIQMDRRCYIRPVGSDLRYPLRRLVNIPIAPNKHYFAFRGEYLTYTLFFDPLPLSTTKIDIIELEAPGNYFNFYGVDYVRWMSVNQQVNTYVLRKATNVDMRDDLQH